MQEPTLHQQLLAAAEAVGGVSVLVLFGSRAGGEPRPDSDLDVAVLPREGVERRKLQWRLAAALEDLAPGGRGDVVFLDEAPALLRQRIMEQGRVLIGADEPAWKELRVRTMREFGDFAWARRMYREAQKRRLQKGDFGGRSGRALESLERTGRLSR